MKQLNVLYGALMGDVVDSGSTIFNWFKKRFSILFPNDKAKAIRDIIMISALVPTPEQKVILAAALCYWVMQTAFGNEIHELDSNNTYNIVTRPSSVSHSDQSCCLYNLLNQIDTQALLRYLDKDIRDRIPAGSNTLAIVAAGCLQLLREVRK